MITIRANLTSVTMYGRTDPALRFISDDMNKLIARFDKMERDEWYGVRVEVLEVTGATKEDLDGPCGAWLMHHGYYWEWVE